MRRERSEDGGGFVMMRLAWQTLRSRRAAFAGTLVALAFGVALLSTMGLVLTASVSGVHDGLGRYADAPVIVRTEPDLSVPDPWGSMSVEPLARPDGLPAALVTALDDSVGSANVVPDRPSGIGAVQSLASRKVTMRGAAFRNASRRSGVTAGPL